VPKAAFKAGDFPNSGTTAGNANAASPEPLGSSGGTVPDLRLRADVRLGALTILGAAAKAPHFFCSVHTTTPVFFWAL
jgi:hypothetical protein